MDIIIALDRLGFLAGEEQSPSPDLSTYQAMVDTWRHTTKSPPTEAALQKACDEYEAQCAATKYIGDREAAMQKLLPESMCVSAILGQAKADREGGKTLCAEMEKAVDVYSKILTDHPKPN